MIHLSRRVSNKPITSSTQTEMQLLSNTSLAKWIHASLKPCTTKCKKRTLKTEHRNKKLKCKTTACWVNDQQHHNIWIHNEKLVSCPTVPHSSARMVKQEDFSGAQEQLGPEVIPDATNDFHWPWYRTWTQAETSHTSYKVLSEYWLYTVTKFECHCQLLATFPYATGRTPPKVHSIRNVQTSASKASINTMLASVSQLARCYLEGRRRHPPSADKTAPCQVICV